MYDAVSRFVERYWPACLTVAGVLLVAVVIWLVWAERERSVTESSALRAEQLQNLYERWVTEPDDGDRGTLGEELLDEADQLLTRFPQRYAAQRALYVRAQYWFELERWQEAADDWLRLADTWPASYLAPLSVFNAAVAAEEENEPARSRARLHRLVTEWGDDVLVPRALFSIGRIEESLADHTAAKAAYDRLTDEHPGSGWATAARNRLIALQVEGRLTAE
jgi:tetratricopeptide (TPR) repeat protein